MLRMIESQCEIQMTAGTVLLQHPNHLHKQGMLHDIQVLIKVPLDRKYLEDISFFELRINIKSGLFNVNKQFV